MSTTARDHKRDRVETTVAAARVRDSARLADPVIPALHASHPRWGPGSTVQGLDGTHVSATEHRLTVWRGTSAAPWPGPACVGLDPQRMLSTDVVPREAGPAQERRMIDQGLSRVRAGEVWIEDRHFCTRRLLCGMARRGAAFLGRQQAQWPGERRGSPTRTGVVRSGTVYAQAMLVHDLARGETMRVRRLTLALTGPPRDGATEIHLLSNIPVEEAAGQDAGGGVRQTMDHRDGVFGPHHPPGVRDQHLGVSQSRAVCVLPRVGRGPRRVHHASGIATCPWAATGRERGVALCSGVGDPPNVRWHADRDPRTPLGGVPGDVCRGVRRGAVRARVVGQALEIPQPSTRSKKETTREDRVQERKSCVDGSTDRATMIMLKGLTLRP